MKIDAVVVTYNRIGKLKKCLSNLLECNLDRILVIDNHSNADTVKYLDSFSNRFPRKIKVYHLKQNIGGAGGFNFGLKKFMEIRNADYVWLMDDDSMPTPESLNKLSNSLNSLIPSKRGFATGSIYWKDGSLAKMNVPRKKDNGMQENMQTVFVNRNVLQENKIKFVVSASFVALLLARSAVENCGFPISEFFIWGDDVEYTSRLTNNGLLGIQVEDAKILHMSDLNVGTNIVNEGDNISRINLHYFDFRNGIYISRHNGIFSLAKTLCERILWVVRILFFAKKYKFLKLKILVKGTLDGFSFNPKIEPYSTTG
ncbi:MAG: glycosyltransferase [Oenococcus sp.]|uniref:glycosyltransferase n=1 Tax=Oenococcus sp. TaxID=1979414 RepID=UPI0039E8048C